MSELTEIKKLPVLRVMALMGEGKGKLEACAEVGISRSTYDRVVAENPDLVQEIVIAEHEMLQVRLEKINSAIIYNQDKYIARANSADLSFRERLALDDKLHELKYEIERLLGINQEETSIQPARDLVAAQDFLNKGIGVRLRPGTGKITQTLEFDIERVEEDIVEGEIKQD